MVDDTIEIILDILDQNHAGEVILNNQAWGNALDLVRKFKTSIEEIVERWGKASAAGLLRPYSEISDVPLSGASGFPPKGRPSFGDRK